MREKTLIVFDEVQLTINGYQTYDWESKRGAEIDFIIQREGRLIPSTPHSASE